MHILFYVLGTLFVLVSVFVGFTTGLDLGVILPIAMTGCVLLAVGKVIDLLDRLLNNARMLVEDQRKSLASLTEIADLMKRRPAAVDSVQGRITNLTPSN